MMFHAKLVKAIDIILNEFHDAKISNKNENSDTSQARGVTKKPIPGPLDWAFFIGRKRDQAIGRCNIQCNIV